MDKDKLGVALTKEACFICGHVQDGAIVMNTLLTEYMAEKVEGLHRQVVGYIEGHCDTCKEHLKLGGIVVVIDEKKSSRETVYRTGEIAVVKKETFDSFVATNPQNKPWDDDFLFIDKEYWKDIFKDEEE